MKGQNLKWSMTDRVGMLSICRPQALNALNAEVLDEMNLFLNEIPQEVACLVVTGEGSKAFVAGADIKEMETMNPDEALKMSQTGQAVMNRLETLKIPTLAMVNGFSLGGGMELALACDFIIASEKAKFGLPEVTLGLIPGYGGTQRLARAVGKSKARMITLTGDLYSAQEMFEWGVVAKVVKEEQLLNECLKIAKKISQAAPGALALAKRAIHEGYDMNQFEGLKLEAELFAEAFKLKDHAEGIQAFLHKRPAQFRGE